MTRVHSRSTHYQQQNQSHPTHPRNRSTKLCQHGVLTAFWGRPASRLTPLPRCRSTPAYSSTLVPPATKAHIYVFPWSRRPSMVRPIAMSHTRPTFPLPVWPFDHSDNYCDYDTIGALCENTSLSIPAYTTSFATAPLSYVQRPSLWA